MLKTGETSLEGKVGKVPISSHFWALDFFILKVRGLIREFPSGSEILCLVSEVSRGLDSLFLSQRPIASWTWVSWLTSVFVFSWRKWIWSLVFQKGFLSGLVILTIKHKEIVVNKVFLTMPVKKKKKNNASVLDQKKSQFYALTESTACIYPWHQK